jgi:hypothetical protein
MKDEDSMKPGSEQRWIEAGSKMPSKKELPAACERCQGTSLKRRVATYPVVLKKPAKIAGKRVDVHRVALHECQECGCLMPTLAGLAKINRCVQTAIEMFTGTAR